LTVLLRFSAAVLLACAAMMHQANASTAAVFESEVPELRLRAGPSVLAAQGVTLPQNDAWPVIAISEDRGWVAVQRGTHSGWAPVGYGVLRGETAQLPVHKLQKGVITKNGNSGPFPAWIRSTPRARQILALGLKSGRDARMFAVAGDSNSAWRRTLGRLANGQLSFAGDRALAPLVARFDAAFARQSVAVGGGYRAADMFLAERAHPSCQPGEPMFPCELRQTNASIVFIQLGTGDKFAWREFEGNLRAMIDHALARNVLPVLVTKADDIDSIQGGAPFNHINDVTRKVAAAYQLPLLDFYAATRDLPVIPNPELPTRPFTKTGLHDEWGYYFHLTDQACELRVLSTLQMLDAVTR
jgi:hypothetical protein